VEHYVSERVVVPRRRIHLLVLVAGLELNLVVYEILEQIVPGSAVGGTGIIFQRYWVLGLYPSSWY
jgi:hypothetical protein